MYHVQHARQLMVYQNWILWFLSDIQSVPTEWSHVPIPENELNKCSNRQKIMLLPKRRVGCNVLSLPSRFSVPSRIESLPAETHLARHPLLDELRDKVESNTPRKLKQWTGRWQCRRRFLNLIYLSVLHHREDVYRDCCWRSCKMLRNTSLFMRAPVWIGREFDGAVLLWEASCCKHHLLVSRQRSGHFQGKLWSSHVKFRQHDKIVWESARWYQRQFHPIMRSCACSNCWRTCWLNWTNKFMYIKPLAMNELTMSQLSPTIQYEPSWMSVLTAAYKN